MLAELNVLASQDVSPEEKWHDRWRKGDFGLWNELSARGHHLMPHGYSHVNKAEVPLSEAKRLIDACLDVFAAELAGFEESEASFAFPTTARPLRSRLGWADAFARFARQAIR